VSSFAAQVPCTSRHTFRVLRRLLQENGYNYEIVDPKFDRHVFKQGRKLVAINRDGISVQIVSDKQACREEGGRRVTVTTTKSKEIYYDWCLNEGEEVLYKVLVDLNAEIKY
jgi:hypothetical protein